MLCRMMGNLTVDGKDYANGKYYELSDDFIRVNSQNVMPFTKMGKDEQADAKRIGAAKPVTSVWDKLAEDKMIRGDDAAKKSKKEKTDE